MIINQALRWGSGQLEKAGVDSPELDAELLLVHALHPSRSKQKGHKCAIAHLCPRDRSWLYGHWEESCGAVALRRFKRLIKRRARREPVAYILGHKEFYGLDFLVNREVLIPRPETEALVDFALNEIQNTAVADVGTGSGAIIISLAKQLECKMFAIDNSLMALQVAKKNARRHGVADGIKFLRGNLLEPLFNHLPTLLFNHLTIIANLPYLPTNEWRATAPEIIKWEPRGALDGGRDGLKYYCQMFKQLSVFIHKHPRVSVLCLCEICPHQFPIFKRMVCKIFQNVKLKKLPGRAGRSGSVALRLERCSGQVLLTGT